jgi:protein phosphatase
MSSDRQHPNLPCIDWHRQRLGKERLRYLRELPPVHNCMISGRPVRLYHASHIGIWHRVRADAPEEEHRAMFTNTEFTGDGATPDVVGYGDIHQCYVRTFRGGGILFNTGSVGNPLDEPRAAYAVLEGNFGDSEAGPFSVQLVRLPYDIDRAVQVAAEEGLPEPEFIEWEDELRTGRYRRDPDSKAWRHQQQAR